LTSKRIAEKIEVAGTVHVAVHARFMPSTICSVEVPPAGTLSGCCSVADAML
jgi:hypothetical protein